MSRPRRRPPAAVLAALPAVGQPRATAPSRPVPPAVSPAERDALRLWVILSRAHGAIAARAAADVARHELTLAEFGVLEVLYHKGRMLLGEVQRSLLVSSGGVTYLVDRLQRRGLVRREACPEDRRARYAALTDEGTAFVRAAFPEHAAVVAAALAALTPDEQGEAARLLKRLGLGAAAAPAPGPAPGPARTPARGPARAGRRSGAA